MDFSDNDVNFTDKDTTYWEKPKSLDFFDSVRYDVDSIAIVGNANMSWLSPPYDFECRLDMEHAVLLDDKKVWRVSLFFFSISFNINGRHYGPFYAAKN